MDFAAYEFKLKGGPGVLSLHAEACPELNGNSEGVVSCVFSFTAALLVRAWRL